VVGAPSVLFDAVAVVTSAEGAADLAERKTACDFVDDAFAHQKFMGWVAAAEALLDAAGVTPDDGCPELTTGSVAGFVEQCAALRHWDRPVRS
jgi:catalase